MTQLSRLRAMAAEGDRGLPVFRPTVQPYKHPKATPYVTSAIMPQDLEALHMHSEPYGDEAVRRACWHAVTTWVLFNARTGLLAHGYVAASDAIRLCSKEDEAISFPDLDASRKPPALPLMPQGEQERIRTVAADTIVEWHEAGSPCLIRAVEQTYGYIVAYKWKVTSKDTANVRV
jgi:hypothetical protein